VSDVIPLNAPPAAGAEPGTPPRKAKRASRKTAAAKTSNKSSARKSRASGANAQVKVGRHTITVPKSLASELTSKDVKKLRAIFKRARKRGQKRNNKKKSVKKSAKKSA
jgi:hypothetical protein